MSINYHRNIITGETNEILYRNFASNKINIPLKFIQISTNNLPKTLFVY